MKRVITGATLDGSSLKSKLAGYEDEIYTAIQEQFPGLSIQPENIVIDEVHIHLQNLSVQELNLSDQGASDSELSDIDSRIESHDESKFDDEEYEAYAEWFYGEHPDEGEAKDAFDLAWVHHQNNNEHHWQYWVLIQDTDEPKYLALDMSRPAICEMLCDWHSFSAKDSESTAYSQYNNNKENMLLSNNTVAVIDSLIDVFKKPLKESTM